MVPVRLFNETHDNPRQATLATRSDLAHRSLWQCLDEHQHADGFFMKGNRRALDQLFDGNERRLQNFVRNDNECLGSILQAAGFDSSGAEVVRYEPRFYGEPDLAMKLADGRMAVVELCFALHARHTAKDLMYLMDPACGDLAGFVWLCDRVTASVLEMIRFYAARFGLSKRITLEVLVPQAGRFDATPPLRFAFDPQLRDLRAGSPRNTQDGATVFRRVAELFRTAEAIDSIALARLLGVTSNWVTQHAQRPKKRHAPRLVCKRDQTGARLRADNNRLVFDLDEVSAFVSDFELLVTQAEAPALRGNTLPLVSAQDPRIGTDWLTLEDFRRDTETKQYAAIKRALDAPVAFCISSSGLGYSVLWPRERRSALRLRAESTDVAR